jgi:hypothetical protein
MRNRNPQIENEVFRAFRLMRTQVEKTPDGELLGAFNRVVVEMVVRNQSPAIIEQLQMQIDFLLAMPKFKKAPRKRKRPWKFWDYGVPISYDWGEYEYKKHHPEPPADRTPTVDTAIKMDWAIDDAEFKPDDAPPDDAEFKPDDAPPGVRRDHTYEREKAQAAIEETVEADEEFKREAARLEDELVARANQEDRQ